MGVGNPWGVADFDCEARTMKEKTYTFEQLTVTEHNRDAITTAKAVASSLHEAGHNPFIVVGAMGSGKSPLIKALAQESAKRIPGFAGLTRKGADLIKEYTDSVTYGYVADFMEQFVKLDELIIDDFDIVLSYDDEAAKKQVALILKGLISHGRQVVIAMEAAPDSYKCPANDELLALLESGTTVVLPEA